MKKIIFITVILVLNVCGLHAQQMVLPPDTTSHCLFPIHKSCIGQNCQL